MDPFTLPPQSFEEDIARRRAMMLPRALGVSAQALPNPLRERLAKIGQDLDAIDTNDVDTSALQAFAQRQGQAGQAAMLNALAAQYAGEQFAPVQGQFLKRALAAQEPMKIGQGMLTPDGQYVKDPFAARDTRRASLERQYGGLLSDLQRQDLAETARQDRIFQQNRDYDFRVQNQADRQADRNRMYELQRDNAEFRRQMMERPKESSYTQSGFFTTDGKQLVTNNTGVNFVVDLKPDGQPTYTPYFGPSIPKTTFDKNVGVVQEALASAKRADAIIKQVTDNPDAFGVRAAAVSRLPEFAQGRVGSLVLTPEIMKLRSDVLRSAAMEISDLYGAALSLGEQARANTFIPNASDPPEVVINKLRAARDWANGTADKYGGGVRNAAQDRSGPQPAAPAAGVTLTAEEQAELDRLRQKHRGR